MFKRARDRQKRRSPPPPTTPVRVVPMKQPPPPPPTNVRQTDNTGLGLSSAVTTTATTTTATTPFGFIPGQITSTTLSLSSTTKTTTSKGTETATLRDDNDNEYGGKAPAANTDATSMVPPPPPEAPPISSPQWASLISPSDVQDWSYNQSEGNSFFHKAKLLRTTLRPGAAAPKTTSMDDDDDDREELDAAEFSRLPLNLVAKCLSYNVKSSADLAPLRQINRSFAGGLVASIMPCVGENSRGNVLCCPPKEDGASSFTRELLANRDPGDNYAKYSTSVGLTHTNRSIDRWKRVFSSIDNNDSDGFDPNDDDEYDEYDEYDDAYGEDRRICSAFDGGELTSFTVLLAPSEIRRGNRGRPGRYNWVEPNSIDIVFGKRSENADDMKKLLDPNNMQTTTRGVKRAWFEKPDKSIPEDETAWLKKLKKVLMALRHADDYETFLAIADEIDQEQLMKPYKKPKKPIVQDVFEKNINMFVCPFVHVLPSAAAFLIAKGAHCIRKKTTLEDGTEFLHLQASPDLENSNIAALDFGGIYYAMVNNESSDSTAKNPEYYEVEVLLPLAYSGSFRHFRFRDELDENGRFSPIHNIVSRYENRGLVEGVFVVDGAIGDGLREKLKHDIDRLASWQENVNMVNYNPHCNNTIRDLVDPSLYPYVQGVSTLRGNKDDVPPCILIGMTAQTRRIFADRFRPRVRQDVDDDEGEGGQHRQEQEQHQQQEFVLPTKDFWGRPYEISKYQWLPTYFEISNDGRCTIHDYINNLLPRADPTVIGPLYEDLAVLFEQCLPYIESVYDYICNTHHDLVAQHDLFLDDTDSDEDYYVHIDWDEGEEGNVVEEEEEEEEHDDDFQDRFRTDYNNWTGRQTMRERPVSFRGQKLQVITKIVDYELSSREDDDDDHCYESEWHVEGFSNEEIILTCYYVLDQTTKNEKNDDGETTLSLTGGEMNFQRKFSLQDESLLYSRDGPEPYQNIIQSGTVPLGKVPICSSNGGRLIVFPNSHIHKIEKLYFDTKQRNQRQEKEKEKNVNEEKKTERTMDGKPSQNEGGEEGGNIFNQKDYHPNDNNPRQEEDGSDNGNDDNVIVGTRRVIIFHLVNPLRRIISTREVAPQQKEQQDGNNTLINKKNDDKTISSKQHDNSDDQPNKNNNTDTSPHHGNMTFQDALNHKQSLLDDRRYYKETEGIRDILLCESLLSPR